MTMVNSYPERMNLSFSGCGFLCIYHAGVAAAIKEYAPNLIQSKISGASAGAIIAATLVTDVCVSQVTSTILRIVSQARSRALGPLHPEFDLLALTRTEIERYLPPDAHKRCTDRLQISLTRWRDSKNVVVTQYDSNKELVDAIICSCYIPIYCGINPPTYRGEAYIDGGFTDNQPVYDDHTVTVSPFCGESDICPPDWDSASFFGFSFSNTSIRFTTRNLFRMTACLMPPSTEDCSKMCLQGFEDALRFLSKNAMAPCIRCLTVQVEMDQKRDYTPDGIAQPFSPIRMRKRTASTAKRRLESECDTCCESEHMYNTSVVDVFPAIITRTFDEAFAAEDSFFKYLLSFRMFRYARTALGLGTLPIDMLIMLARNVSVWMSSVVAPEWLRRKINAIVDFVLMEIERQKSRYSQFACLLPVSEIGYRAVVSRREPEIELSEDARKELAFIKESDKKKKAKVKVRVEAPTASTLQDWAQYDDANNEDSFQHVIAYSNNHDSMYQFHYLDENHRLRKFELFNVADPNKRHECHAPLREVSPVHPVSDLIDEKDELMEEYAESASKAEEGDSGLSGVEGQADTGRRDACCSPVRHFPSSARMSGRSKPSSRRHPSAGGSSQPSTSRKQYSRSGSIVSCSAASGSCVRSASSGSEGDGADNLFVPARRQRTSSIEYDGEPEQSDADILA